MGFPMQSDWCIKMGVSHIQSDDCWLEWVETRRRLKRLEISNKLTKWNCIGMDYKPLYCLLWMKSDWVSNDDGLTMIKVHQWNYLMELFVYLQSDLNVIYLFSSVRLVNGDWLFLLRNPEAYLILHLEQRKIALKGLRPLQSPRFWGFNVLHNDT